MIAPRVAVLMPTYGHAPFIRRALESLRAQTLDDWELIIVDDGSPDDTAAAVAPYRADPRVRYLRLERNRGLGAALNTALDLARAPLVAYLPSDDVYYAEHLAALITALEGDEAAVLAYSGVRHHYNRAAPGPVEGYPLQLAQVAHRRVGERWIARDELVTDDLERMYWARLRPHGRFVGTGEVSCEWVDHPGQRHKVIREPLGGLNPYRARYNVAGPLRFHSSAGNRVDEAERYRPFRARPTARLVSPAPEALESVRTSGTGERARAGGLKILLVGELAYNAERVLALEERGHTLYGLWTPEPYWFNTVGPLPFGHVRDLPRDNWQAALQEIKPDVIYALLNWQAVPFAHHVLAENPGVPFVWHFKEGPFICLEKGLWPRLVDLYTRSDGQIYSSPESRDWFVTVVPGLADRAHSLVLDGDLPKREWFTNERAPRLSEADGEPHTVVPGRPIGLHPWTVGELAAQGIHLHFYGDFTQGQWVSWIEQARALAPRHLHLHPNVDQEGWVEEFSRYDAGWLHLFESANGGELRRAIWDDLNYPARIATLAAAGLPMIQGDNRGHIVATQSLARDYDSGLFVRDMADLRAQLDDVARMDELRANVWRRRMEFTFDHHTDRLVDFFRRVIAARH